MSYVVHNGYDTGVHSSFDDLNEARAFYWIEGQRLRARYGATYSDALVLSEITFGGDEGKVLESDNNWPPDELDEWKNDWSDEVVASAQRASDKLVATHEANEAKWKASAVYRRLQEEAAATRPRKRKITVDVTTQQTEQAAKRRRHELTIDSDDVQANAILSFVQSIVASMGAICETNQC